MQPPQFKDTVFKAKVGSLVGPIKTDRGFYVVKVQKITYSKKPTFKEYKAQAEQQLASELLQAKIDRFREAFTIRWAGRTSCASEFNDLAACDDDALRPSTPAPLAPAPAPCWHSRSTTRPQPIRPQPSRLSSCSSRCRRPLTANGGGCEHRAACAARAPADPSAAELLVALDQLVRQLREHCPWDREQDERSIVPHTLDEAYEVADAAMAGEDAHLADELGDLLFQVLFLTLLLEERGAGSLSEVAQGLFSKLVRRHPHVFGDAVATTAGEVRSTWEQVKRGEDGRAAASSVRCPAAARLLLARKSQRRVAHTGANPLQPLGLEAQERALPEDDAAAFRVSGG